MKRIDAYKRLRDVIRGYAESLKNIDLETFALEMELFPDEQNSEDPALLSVFQKLLPENLRDGREALLLSAAYIWSELVTLRRVRAAEALVADLQEAAEERSRAKALVGSWPE
jgi:hypothetical protein